jgi:hypothetical protein
MTTETYKIAHIREQGQNMIIIPVASSVNCKTQNQQNELLNTLQYFARDAGLAGTVCLVWEVGNRLSFLAPSQWHGFFRSMNMRFVSQNINKNLTCNIQ